jgi:hypothetical protein
MSARVQRGQAGGVTTEENRRASASARSRWADEGGSPPARSRWTSRAAASARRSLGIAAFAAYIRRMGTGATPNFAASPSAHRRRRRRAWRGEWSDAPSVEVVVRRAAFDRSDGQPMFDIEALRTDPQRLGEVVARTSGSLSRALASLTDELTDWAAIEYDLGYGDEV